MKKMTLCFCVRQGEVLLAMKKRGFGAGKWNGYGGKVLPGESVVEGVIRELKEESSLVCSEKDLEQMAIVNFSFEGKLLFECHVYKTRVWKGEPVETEEMRPKWYKTSDLPFGEMWAADLKWIPSILRGEKIKVDVDFSSDGTVVKSFHSEPVASFLVL